MSQQAMDALRSAQNVRLPRANERRRVHGMPTALGMAKVADLIAEPPPYLLTARVADVLHWPHRAQGPTLRGIMRRAGVSETTTVGALTYRQRAALVEQIDDRYGEIPSAAA